MIYPERFMKGIITIGLVLLITIQLMMGFDQTRNMLRWVEGQIHEVVDPEVQQVSTTMEYDQYVTLKLLNPGDYSKARILVNNEYAYNFDQRVVKVPVKNNDLLIFDTRSYLEAVWFEVLNFSQEITNLKEGQQFRVKCGFETIPIEVKYQSKF